MAFYALHVGPAGQRSPASAAAVANALVEAAAEVPAALTQEWAQAS